MIGSVHRGTVNNLLLGAGLFLRDFHFDPAEDAGSLLSMVKAAVAEGDGVLGATRGGGSLICVPRLRELDADGTRSPFVGGTLCDGWTVRMTGTLLEITPGNLSMLLAMGDVRKNGAVTTVTARQALRESDYLTSLCWIGESGCGLVLIELLGALNMNGVTLTIRDKGEGSMPFVFEAHTPDPEQQETPPFRIVFFDGGEHA